MNAMSPSNASPGGRFVLHDRREEIEQAERAVLDEIEARRFDRASVFAIRLSLEEALANAFKHGNKGDQRKTVRLEWRIEGDTVVLEVEDQGEGFDPDSVPDPTEEENVEIPSGRGLKLIRSFMTEVQIPPPGNRVRMIYVRPQPA
jgi:serine/threonine-protein kinase RsbW